MFVSLFAILGVLVFLASVVYENRRRTQWEAIGRGIWVQRRMSKYKAHFVFRTSDDLNPTSLVPALWEIKKPFSDSPKYITQHPEQLRAWWEPLTIQFAALGRDPKRIKSIRFSPSLGIYLQVDETKKTQRATAEDLIATLLEEARNTWNPRRFDVDNSYPIRQSLLANWHWPFAAALGVLFQGLLQYRYVDFLGDTYYIGVGFGMAIVAALGLVFWYYPKMDGCVHRIKALYQIVLLSLVCMGITFPYALVWTNMRSTRTVCEMPVPVTQWYTRSGKSRSYYAVLDLNECSTAIPASASVKVAYSEYQHGNKMNVRVSRGILGRYYLEPR